MLTGLTAQPAILPGRVDLSQFASKCLYASGVLGSVVGVAFQDKSIDLVVAQMAASLNQRLAPITAQISEVLRAEIPELRVDSQLLGLLAASVESNLDTIFHMLQHDIAPENLDAPAAATEYARRLSQHAVPVNSLVRAYRVGQSTLVGLIFEELYRLEVAPELGVPVVQRIITIMSAYIDRVSQQVVDIYELERERWLAHQSSVRAVRVHEILAGNAPADASAALKYSLQQNHVAAIVWVRNTETAIDRLADLESAVRGLSAFLGSTGEPLFVAADRVTGWLWVPLGTRSAPAVSTADLCEYLATHHESIVMAIGSRGFGSRGFRQSHMQARKARALALAAGGQAHSVTAYDEPGVSTLSLLVDDLNSTRDWVQHVLRGLGRDTESAARLRETLRVYLANGASNTTTGEILNLHYNSVKYRVKRAAQERGEDFRNDRLDVEVALLACHWLGSAVLAQMPDTEAVPVRE